MTSPKPPVTKRDLRAAYVAALSVMPWWQDAAKRDNFIWQIDRMLAGDALHHIDLKGVVLCTVWTGLGLPKRPNAARIAALPD